MAAGAGLKHGEYKSGPLSEDEMWSAFAYLFSSKAKHSSTYKFGLLKSILDNLYNTDENLVLTFDQLFSKFAECYWNLVLKHKLLQCPIGVAGKPTKLEQILWETKQKYQIEENIPFESLTPEMDLFVCRKVKLGCKPLVVGALYGDLQELFYSFDIKEEWIQINPVMYEFVCKHKTAIEKLNYYEWAKYLEKINSDNVLDHLLTKIDESSKRKNLSYYRNILFEEFENRCFYCNKPLNANTDLVHVDHFIPWSFVKDDNLWNFVLACETCNTSKNDKLASEEKLVELIERNSGLVIEKKNISLMRNYQSARLQKIYSWAKNNGYSDIWVPKEKKCK